MSEMEKDFTEVVSAINAKIKEAAKAMKEANKLGKEAGLSQLTLGMDEETLTQDEIAILEQDEIDIYPLFNELDKAGWRTSSIGC